MKDTGYWKNEKGSTAKRNETEKNCVRTKDRNEDSYKFIWRGCQKQAMKILGSEAQAEKCRNTVMLMLEESLENLGEYGSSQAKSYIFQLTCCCAEILKGKE